MRHKTDGDGSGNSIRYVSFDLDGTLSTPDFDEAVWRDAIPRAYAATKGMPIPVALATVQEEYEAFRGRIGGKWRDPLFWLDHFGLSLKWEHLFESVRHRIEHYPETIDVLDAISRRFKLILITSASTRCMEAKLSHEGLGDRFERVYSVSSDFDMEEKDETVFQRVLDDLGLTAEEIVHVGDHPIQDVSVPRRVGMESLLLDRLGTSGYSDLHEVGERLFRHRS